MSDKDDSVYIEHILDCIHQIDEYVEDEAQFYRSRLVQDAVIRNLQVLAESTQKLSESYKQERPDIPWKEISGFRNVLAHDYLGVSLDAVWSVIEKDLPLLSKALGGLDLSDR